MGPYALFQDNRQGNGIRPRPYSRDMTKNGFSFRHIQAGEELPDQIMFELGGPNNEVHNAGEVWTAALWEGYVALQKAGNDFIAVRQRMAQYVVAGLLLAPNEASPMETLM